MTKARVRARAALGAGVAVVILLAWLLLRPARLSAFPVPPSASIVLDTPAHAR